MVSFKMIALSILKILVVALAAALVLGYFFQSRLVYFPLRDLVATPADIGCRYEEIFFPTADGARLCGWYVPAEPARGTVLMCHGNGGNISDRLYAIDRFHRLRLNVFIFDYRGYGKSSGRPTEAGTYQDALAAWRYLREQRQAPADKLILFGRSLGGAVAAWLAEQHAPAGLILEATFTSVPDLAARLYPFLPARFLCRYRYDTLSRIGRLRCPILIAHSPTDDLVPYEHGQKLFAAAPEPRVFAPLSGSHNDGEIVFPESYQRALDRFLATSLKAGL